MTTAPDPFAPLVARIERVYGSDGAVEVTAHASPSAGTAGDVDVVVRTEVAGCPARIAIECRDRGRRHHLPWIDAVVDEYAGRGIDKIVLVSRAPFSATAATHAGRKGLHLWSLVDADDEAWVRALAKVFYVPYLERAQVALTFTLADEVATTAGHAISDVDQVGLATHAVWRRLRQAEADRGDRTPLPELAKRRRVRFLLPPALPGGIAYLVDGAPVAATRIQAEVTWWREPMLVEYSRALLTAVGTLAPEPLRAVTDVSCNIVGGPVRVTVVEDAEGLRLGVYPPSAASP